jgi:hypothetical protein
MNAMHSIKIIYPSLCEKRIVFRLTFLLPKILFLSLFKTQQQRLGVDSIASDRRYSFDKCHHHIKIISGSEGKDKKG